MNTAQLSTLLAPVGQLLPALRLILQAGGPVGDYFQDMGRATIESVLLMGNKRIVAPPKSGSAHRAIGYHGRKGRRVNMKECGLYLGKSLFRNGHPQRPERTGSQPAKRCTTMLWPAGRIIDIPIEGVSTRRNEEMPADTVVVAGSHVFRETSETRERLLLELTVDSIPSAS